MSIISKLNFDEISGTIASDTSGNNNHADMIGGLDASNDSIEGASSNTGTALKLDGVDDYLQLPNNSFISSGSAYSISGWVRGIASNRQAVFSESSSGNNIPLFRLLASNTSSTSLEVFLRATSGTTLLSYVQSDQPVFDGQWHFISWTDDGLGDAHLYIDGVLDSTDYSYSPQSISVNRMSIGATVRIAISDHFAGSVDQWRFDDTKLSSSEVLDLYLESIKSPKKRRGLANRRIRLGI